MSELVPCPGCHRHVRVRETGCPFCACALPEREASAPAPKPRGRMSRAALFAAGAALLGTAACAPIYGTPAPAYGAPAPDASADSTDAKNMTGDASGGDDANADPDATTGTADGSVSEMGTLIYGSPPPSR